MEGRYDNGVGYRYAYNGMETDPEMKGDGNSYTTEFRQYDPRLGRWVSLDPLMMEFPWMSPYCAFDNNPILYTDPFGLAPVNDDGEPETKNWQLLETCVDENLTQLRYLGGDEWQTVETDLEEFTVYAGGNGWTRFWGFVKAVAGTIEAAVGAALIATGVGAGLGVLLFAHGADVAASGVIQAASGENTESLTYQGVHKVAKSLGASDEVADGVAQGTEIVISGAAGGATTKVPTPKINTKVVTAEEVITETVIAGSSSNRNIDVLEEIISEAVTGRATKGQSTLYEKTGGFEEALSDFDRFELKDIKDIPNVGKMGTMSDGRKVIVRTRSTDGRPTLEVQSGKKATKIRY